MENISKQEIEWDEDNEKQEDPVEDQDDEICIATKTDGHPCLGLKYKDTDYCYSHLTKMKMLPSRVVPVDSLFQSKSLNEDATRRLAQALPKRGRPKKIQIDPSFHQVAVAVRSGGPDIVAPVASTSVSDNLGTDSLIVKLTQRLKIKIDQIDNETKLLLKLLL